MCRNVFCPQSSVLSPQLWAVLMPAMTNSDERCKLCLYWNNRLLTAWEVWSDYTLTTEFDLCGFHNITLCSAGYTPNSCQLILKPGDRLGISFPVTILSATWGLLCLVCLGHPISVFGGPLHQTWQGGSSEAQLNPGLSGNGTSRASRLSAASQAT